MKKFLKYAFILMCVDSISKSIFKYIEAKALNSKIFNQGQLIILVVFIIIAFFTIIILKSNKASKTKIQENNNTDNNTCCSCRCCQCCRMKSVNHNM